MDQNNSPDLQQPQQPQHAPQQYLRARTVFFFLLLALILLFNGNPIAQTVCTAFLSIGEVFGPVFNPILRPCEIWIITPLGRFWRGIFRDPLPSLAAWFRLHRQRVTEVVSIIAIAILLMITTLRPYVTTTAGSINDYFCLKQTLLPWPTCSSGYGISALPDGVRVGLISDSTYGSFDRSAFNQKEKLVENHIFDQNRKACTADHHITLVVATMLSRTVEDPLSGATLGLQNLYGYYLWQHHYNAQSPSVPLCLAIANLGTPDTANNNSSLVKSCSNCYSMPQVIMQIARLAHSDPNVRGIVGFPYSQQAEEALKIVKEYPGLADISIVSPTASSDDLSNRQNFYRIDAPDQIQGEALARYFCSRLAPGPGHPPVSVALLTDNPDYYSGDLSQDFKTSIKKSCSEKVNLTPFISYTNGDSSSIQEAVDKALSASYNARYIFFPGYDEDMDVVEAEIHNKLPENFNTVAILGGDGLNNVDATTHYAYTPVYAASFEQPLPWLSDPIIQDLKNEKFSQQYPAGSSSIWIPKDTLLAIDAAHVFTQTVQNLGQVNFDREAFNTALQTVIVTDGESGQIVFHGNRSMHNHISDRDQETVYITCYDTSHRLNMMYAYDANIDNGTVLGIASPPSYAQYDTKHC